MPLPRPPEPYRTWLGRLLGSEEAADKERLRIRRRQALEEHRYAEINMPEANHAATMPKVREAEEGLQAVPGALPQQPSGGQDAVPGVPESARRLWGWLKARGFRVYLEAGRLKVGPLSKMSRAVKDAVIREREGLKLLAPNIQKESR